MSSRARILSFHRCLALVFAPLLFLQAVTGLVLLFKVELVGLTVPRPTERPNLTPDVPVSSLVFAAAQEPGYRVSRIFLPSTTRDIAFAHLSGADGRTSRYAALDPSNARVLAIGPIWRFPVEAALQLHYRLNAERLGMVIVLLNALALLLMSTTGMLYWWPGRQKMARALVIQASMPPRVRLRQWHRSTGVILLPLVFFSSITGALLIIPDLAAAAGPAAVVPMPTPNAVSIDGAFARAKAVFPNAAARDIRFPPADRIDVNFWAPRHNTQAVDVVSVRLSDAALLKSVPAESNPALWIPVLPLHSGTEMGVLGRSLLVLEGLTLLVLAVTGPRMWWQARRPRRSIS